MAPFVPDRPIVYATWQSVTPDRTPGSAMRACHKGVCWDRCCFRATCRPSQEYSTASTSAIISMPTIPSFTLRYGHQKTHRGCSVLMCVEEVTRWFLINWLLLNASKTEAIAFGTQQQLVKRSSDTSLMIDDASLAIVDNVKLLGVIFDSTLSMDKQVNAVVKACNFHIRALLH